MIVFVLPDYSTEDALLARARRGDQRAVTEIYDVFFEPVFQFVRMRVDDLPQAEDLTSEVFVRLVTALRGRKAPRQTLRGWLFRVARNVLHDHYRQSKFTETVLDEWLPAPEDDAPETQVFATLDAEQVRAALRRLPVDQQEVVLLRFGQMLSLQETADVMGKQVGAIKSLQFRATDRLRRIMSDMTNGIEA